MKADIRHGAFRTCHLCAETTMDALVVTESRSITICTSCLEKLLPAIERAKRKDQRTLFTEAVR